MDVEFEKFPSIPRLSREIIITEKIDGTNAQIRIEQDGTFLIGSRKKWITPEADNHGFARWALEHKDELMELGPGAHYGEWWGSGIQRRYDLPQGEKRFSLFNTSRWAEERPACCYVVPILARSEEFDTRVVSAAMDVLRATGSEASPGFMRPEGIVVFHAQGNVLFKKTFDSDDKGKSYGS